MIILGDRPTVPDMIGFALIFSAAACVMLPQRAEAAARAAGVISPISNSG